jgi:hypothetical protein
LNAELEGKTGAAISADTHARIGKATENIMSGVKELKSLVNESQRYNTSIAQPLYASSSETFDTKEADDPLVVSLRELRESLAGPSSRTLESRMDEIDARIGVELAMANLLLASE